MVLMSSGSRVQGRVSFSGTDPDRGQVLNGAGWSVLAWNPAWIREREGAWLHANFLMHKSNSPEGLRLIDQQRHGGDRGTLRDQITLGDSEQNE